MKNRNGVLLGIFLLSGFCGLIYESIWAHYLKLILGHAAYAQAVVLVVFVGGMALGAWLAGRFSERLRQPLLLYAAAEALVALMAFGFHAVFVEASAWALDWLLPTTCSGTGNCWAGWLLAAALILPGAVLLGSTYPLMSAAVLRRGGAPGHTLALLYFSNSLGAAVGVLVCGYWMVPELGLPGTLLLSGALNALVALAAWVCNSWPERAAAAQRPQVATAGAGGSAWLLWVAALTGASSFIYEVVWIRMLAQVLGAATHAFELMLASFILGLALGGWWIRKRIDGLQQPERLLARVQIAMGLAAVATLPLYLWCFDAMAYTLYALSRSAGAYLLYSLASAAMAMAVMLPASICAGMTLPLITAVLLRRGGGERQIGHVYSANTLGAIVGVLLAVHLLLPAVGLKWSLASGALIDLLLGALILWRAARAAWQPRAWVPLLGAAAVCLLALALTAATTFQPERIASGVFRSGTPHLRVDNRVLYQRDGRTASITVVQASNGTRSLRTNGKSDGATDPQSRVATEDDRTVLLLGALGPAHHPRARHAAVVGLGTGLTSSVLLKVGALESVETIEIEPMMLEAAQYFRPRNAAVFDDPRSRIVIDDARAHFARSAKRYDLIVSEPSNPWVSGVASLFGTEFYERAADKLTPDGVFVQWLQLYEASPQMVASIIRAFAGVFPEFRVYGSNPEDVVLVGRRGGTPLQLSPRAFELPGLREQLAPIGIDSAALLAAHDLGRGSFVRMVVDAWGAPPNSDYFPYVDNRAARDRFTGVSATALQEQGASAVPLLEFGPGAPWYAGQVTHADDAMPRRVRDLASGWHGARYLRGQPLEPAERKLIGGYLKEYELTRNWLWACVPLTRDDLWDAALVVAGEVNPALNAAQANALWREVLAGPCRKHLRPQQRIWLELFAAVGARDARLSVAAADQLLEQAAALSPLQHDYVLLAATTARIALGQREQARLLFDRERVRLGPEREQQPRFRYLALALLAQPRPPDQSQPAPAPTSTSENKR